MLVPLTGGASQAHSQSASIRGFITDRSDGQPLELVNVVLLQGDAFVKGVTTNQDGLYILSGIEPGRYVVRVSFVGYAAHTDTLALAPREVRTLNVSLVPDEGELDEVLVESERESGAARVTAGRQVIRPEEIERIPTLDVSGDLASYLTTQPGVVSTGDQGGQLFVRGGEPSQNLVQLDGMLLYQPFHILGFYSAFPSEIINRPDVYAGGFGSKFGERIASVIDIATRNGNLVHYTGQASLSPFLATALLEGPIVPGRVSLLASLRQSVIENGAARYVADPLPYEFGDAFVKIHSAVSSSSRLSATALHTSDRGTLGQETGAGAAEEIRWTNEAAGLRWLVLPRIVPILADLHLSFSRLKNEFGPSGAPLRTSSISNTYLALEATFLGDRIDVQAGTALRLSSLESEIGGLFQNVENRLQSATNWGSYLDFDIDVGGGLRIRPGVRMQFYNVRYEPFLEPRLRLVWEHGAHQISGAAGLYQQELLGLSDRRDAASIFTVWTNIPSAENRRQDLGDGTPQRAYHALLGYQVTPAPWLDLSVEGFYKKMTNLFVAEWTALPLLSTRLQPAHGRSAGLDLRLEIRLPRFYGFINYGLSSTRYDAEQASLAIWYGTEALSYRPPHDRRHQLNVLGSTRLYGFDVNVRWAFGSGLPFSQALGFDGYVPISEVVDVSKVTGSRRVIYERPYNAVLPTYHRLDVSVDRTFSAGPVDITLQASAINAYDRRNLFYFDVFTLRRADQLPFVPSLGLKVEFQ